jgi:hypothetical protein
MGGIVRRTGAVLATLVALAAVGLAIALLSDQATPSVGVLALSEQESPVRSPRRAAAGFSAVRRFRRWLARMMRLSPVDPVSMAESPNVG